MFTHKRNDYEDGKAFKSSKLDRKIFFETLDTSHTLTRSYAEQALAFKPEGICMEKIQSCNFCLAPISTKPKLGSND